MANFSDRLQEICNARGVTQRWLAQKSNTTEATISRYFVSGYPTVLDTVKLIATALNVTTDYLLGVSDLPHQIEDLSPEAVLLNKCYNRMNDADKLVLWALLDRYIAPVDKNDNPYIKHIDDNI